MNSLRLAVTLAAFLAPAATALADAASDGDRCNASTAEAALAQLQIDGCSARINSGEEREANLFAAYYNRASAYYVSGDYTRAIADYTAAMGLKPQDPNVYGGRGLAYYRKGQFELAASDFGQAIKLKPDFA